MRVFQDLQSFVKNAEQEEETPSEWGKQGEAYLIRDCGVNSSMMAVPSFKPMMEIFGAQLPMSSQARAKLRSQTPLKLAEDLVKKIESWLHEMTPNCIVSWPENSPHSAISVYGMLPKMVFVGTEFQGLASLRVSIKGTREVLIVNFAELWACLTDQQQVIPKLDEGANVTHYVAQLVGTSDPQASLTQEIITKAPSGKRLITRAVVEPGSCLCVPAGAILLERVCNAEACVGLRLSICDKSPASSTNFKKMVEVHGSCTAGKRRPQRFALCGSLC